MMPGEKSTNSTIDNGTDDRLGVSRRATLGLIGLGGLSLLSSQSAASQDNRGNQPWCNWQGDVDANEYALENLGALAMADNPTPIQDFAGDNLEINDGVLNADVEESSLAEQNFVLVDAFGAEGDGETDDTDAIQAAADSLDEDEKGVLLFSAGDEYYITDTIDVDISRIRGVEGNNARIIVDTDIVAFDFAGTHTGSANPGATTEATRHDEMNAYVRDLRISSITETYVGTGIRISNSFGFRARGNHLYNLKTGIAVADVNRDMIISANNIWDNRLYGVYFAPTLDIHQINMLENHISYATKGIYLDNGDLVDLQLIGNDIEASSNQNAPVENICHFDTSDGGWLHAIRIIGNTLQDHEQTDDGMLKITSADTSIMQIADNHIQNTNGDIIVVDGTVSDLQIQDNELNWAGGAAIRMTGDISNFRIDGNECLGVDKFLVGDFSGSLLGEQIIDNRTTPLSAPQLEIETTGNIREVSVRGNVAYWDESTVNNDGFGIEVSTDGDMTDFIFKDNQLTARGGTFDGMRVSADGSKEGIIIKDNIVRALESDSTAFDFPDEAMDSIIVNDNLDVQRQ